LKRLKELASDLFHQENTNETTMDSNEEYKSVLNNHFKMVDIVKYKNPKPSIFNDIRLPTNTSNQNLNQNGNSKLYNYENTKATINNPRCSRVFIINVLAKLSEYVKGYTIENICLINEDVIISWYNNAKLVCLDKDYHSKELFYGGSPFFELDEGTYWTEPFQLYGYIKSNFQNSYILERLKLDSLYIGSDPIKEPR
jgi:hypothetical protein